MLTPSLICYRFLATVVSINLAGVMTFLFQGIRPKKWWEVKNAKNAVRMAIILWIVLLLALAVLILLEQLEQRLKHAVSCACHAFRHELTYVVPVTRFSRSAFSVFMQPVIRVLTTNRVPW